MIEIILLGSSGAIPSSLRDNTSLLFNFGSQALLVDCPGSIVHKLLKVGVPIENIYTIVITHAHIDHIYGLVHFLHVAYLQRREAPLTVLANNQTLYQIERILEAFSLGEKKFNFRLDFMQLPEEFETKNFTWKTLEVKHNVPTCAIKLTTKGGGFSCAYSADTEPIPQLVEFVCGVDLLIHECSFYEQRYFHSSPNEIANLATQAKVKNLVLVHLPPHQQEIEKIKKTVEENFDGNVIIGQDFQRYIFNV